MSHKYTIKRQVTEEIEFKVGDTVVYAPDMEWAGKSGVITHIFDGGKRVILDDKDVVWVSDFNMLNGKVI